MIKTGKSNGRYAVDNIIAILDTYSDEDLRKLNQAAYNILNGKRKKKIAAKKSELYVGMEVKFDGRTGTIRKINRTKCVVEVPGGPFGSQSWNVPMTMVTPA